MDIYVIHYFVYYALSSYHQNPREEAEPPQKMRRLTRSSSTPTDGQPPLTRSSSHTATPTTVENSPQVRTSSRKSHCSIASDITKQSRSTDQKNDFSKSRSKNLPVENEITQTRHSSKRNRESYVDKRKPSSNGSSSKDKTTTSAVLTASKQSHGAKDIDKPSTSKCDTVPLLSNTAVAMDNTSSMLQPEQESPFKVWPSWNLAHHTRSNLPSPITAPPHRQSYAAQLNQSDSYIIPPMADEPSFNDLSTSYLPPSSQLSTPAITPKPQKAKSRLPPARVAVAKSRTMDDFIHKMVMWNPIWLTEQGNAYNFAFYTSS